VGRLGAGLRCGERGASVSGGSLGAEGLLASAVQRASSCLASSHTRGLRALTSRRTVTPRRVS